MTMMAISPSHAQEEAPPPGEEADLARLLAPGYRVEIIVLRHLDGYSERTPVEWLNNFSTAVDLMPPPAEDSPENDQERQENFNATITSAESADDGDGAEPANPDESENSEEPLPEAIWIEERSEAMAQAWRRLRGSAGFRPELYFSWQQADAGEFPTIRIHDQEILITEQPPYGSGEAVDGSAVPTFTDANTTMDGDEILFDEQIPDPIYYFRIDGTARLRRSRFIHLDLAVEYREPLFEAQSDPLPRATSAAPGRAINVLPDLESNSTLLTYPGPRPSGYRVHTITQQRQVSTRELEYFDGPVIAVIAYITRIEEEVAEEP